MGHLTNVQRLEPLPYFLVSRREAVLWPKGQGSRLAHDAQGGAVVLWPTGQGPRPTALEEKRSEPAPKSFEILWLAAFRNAFRNGQETVAR